MGNEKNNVNLPQKGVNITPDIGNPLLTKEQLKSFFYLAAGKLDSNIKIFKKQIIINAEDLVELNNLIQEKLKNHDIAASVASINVSFDKNKMTQFGVWQEFVDSNWKIPEVIENITMMWDFLVTLPHFTQPQRHTLTVKITADTNFATILPALLSGSITEVDTMELKHSPVVCQVDFINHLLSDELINIVERWVEGRKIISVDTKIKKWIQKNRRIFADLINYSIPLFITMASLSILHNYSKSIDNTLNTGVMLNFMYWQLLSIVGILGSAKMSNRLAHYTFRAISEYGDFLIFNITNGDKNKQSEINNKNKKEFRKFLFGTVGGLTIDIIASVISYLILK